MRLDQATLASGKNMISAENCQSSKLPSLDQNDDDLNTTSATVQVERDPKTRKAVEDDALSAPCARLLPQQYPSMDIRLKVKQQCMPRRFSISSQCLPPRRLSIIFGGKTEGLLEKTSLLSACPRTAPRSPPTTKEMLDELDIPRIINNVTLRHEINFDHELTFRPNLDGPSGRWKLEAAHAYWSAVTAELQLCTLSRIRKAPCDEVSPDHSTLRETQGRIPLMLKEIREILITLVPDNDRSQIEEVVDVDLIMQQISKGCYDVVNLAQWLAQTLKAHCAPMRDQWVERMVKLITQGVEEADASLIVAGLRELFGILEAMKLDVANHQIRYLRGLLIEDTIKFEQTYFLREILTKRIGIDFPQFWYEKASSRVCQKYLGLECGISRFVWALSCQIVNVDTPVLWPSTLRYDMARLHSLQTQVEDFVIVELCCDVLDKWHRQLGRGRTPDSAKQTLRNMIAATVGRGPDRWVKSIPNVSVEIARLSLCQGHSTWSRFSDLAFMVHEELSVHINLTCGRSHSYLDRRRRQMRDALFERVHHLVTKHMDLTPAAILNSLVKPHTKTLSVDFSVAARLDDMSRRIAHIACLHWKVWGPLVYEKDWSSDENSDDDLSVSGLRPGQLASDCSLVEALEGKTDSELSKADVSVSNVSNEEPPAPSPSPA